MDACNAKPRIDRPCERRRSFNVSGPADFGDAIAPPLLVERTMPSGPLEPFLTHPPGSPRVMMLQCAKRCVKGCNDGFRSDTTKPRRFRASSQNEMPGATPEEAETAEQLNAETECAGESHLAAPCGPGENQHNRQLKIQHNTCTPARRNCENPLALT